ncbi:MAG: ANTAR domain-containing protein [Eubacterium sp.]|nr:ANTAR domain-containing protein [Eubacterium sp.]
MRNSELKRGAVTDIKNILIVAKTQDVCDGIAQMLAEIECDITALTMGSVARAAELDKFDSVIISTPLSDEFGLDLAAEISRETRAGIVVLTKGEIADEVQRKIRFTGAFVIARPFTKAVLIQTLKNSSVAMQNVSRLEEEKEELSRQLSDMKLVTRAKEILMEYLKLTEEQAHRHIQKQAMDLRKTQRAVAEDILKTYQNRRES